MRLTIRGTNIRVCMDSTNGSYCGIGVEVTQNMSTGIITVTRVFEGSPAEEAGMLPGDVLYRWTARR